MEMINTEHTKVSCFDIHVFEKNPRIFKNPRYDDIKESIKNRGVRQALNIFKHPKTGSWILSQGGQTRLEICRELYEDTQDDKYLYPPVIIGETESDLDLCIDHLIENDLRARNSFYERSIYVHYIAGLLSAEKGSELTQDEISDEMKSRGLPIRRQSITSMRWVADVIAPNVTNTIFLENLTRKSTDQLRSLRKKLSVDSTEENIDLQLIAFINDQEGNVSPKSFQDQFKASQQNSQISDQVKRETEIKAEVFGLVRDFGESTVGIGHLVKLTDLRSGYVMVWPAKFNNKAEESIWWLLVSLSKAFDSTMSPDEFEEILGLMGLTTELQHIEGPINLKSVLKDLGWKTAFSPIDALDIPGQFIATQEITDKEFETIIKLFTIIRKLDCHNYQLTQVG